MPPVSKIAKLPPALREQLHQAFVAHAYGDIEAVTAKLNAWLQQAGIDMTIGKSAVGEESQRVRRAQEAMAATTKAMQFFADTAPDEADKRGEALNAIVSTGMFEALVDASQAGEERDPAKRIALLNKAALAAGRLTTTSVRQRAFRHLVEERTKAAADAVERIARKGGMKPAQVQEIKARIMGIAQVPQSARANDGGSPEDPLTQAQGATA
ncbi:MAG: DUF3486 family protein [Rubrivivax sp.]|nr:DUF3486 family protein [Rubrivivax sp.]MDP3610919.1 DUF3486 family protein [Rubrivivax sp.]